MIGEKHEIGGNSRRKIFRILALVVILVVFSYIVFYGFNYTSSPINNGVITKNSILVPENTVFAIQSQHFTYVHFELLGNNFTLNGNVTSSTYVTIYLLNYDQFQNFTKKNKFDYIFNAFADSGANVFSSLGGGSYYLLFYNNNQDWGVGVQFTSDLVVQTHTSI